MRDLLKIIGFALLILVLLLAMSYAFGWFGVGYTKTVGKAKQDADRQVFEETQSYVEGKRQEALKLYREWNECEDMECKKGIESYVRTSFANFDETKLSPELERFVSIIKYK